MAELRKADRMPESGRNGAGGTGAGAGKAKATPRPVSRGNAPARGGRGLKDVQAPAVVLRWVARVAFGIVFIWNVMCACQFFFMPGDYVAAYQLSGPEGEAALRGLGVAFLMWNATYPVFLWSPSRNKVLGIIILCQQAIGLVGEIAITMGLPRGYEVLSVGIARFVGFDAIGLVIMAVAFYLLFKKDPKRDSKKASA